MTSYTKDSWVKKKIELSPNCIVELDVWGGVSLEYTEISPDPWYGDTETSVDIDKEKAKEIIEMLKEAFNIS